MTRLVLCNLCVRARGGSSSVGRESWAFVLAGRCDDCGAALCTCDGRHKLPHCPLVGAAKRARELRAFFVRGISETPPHTGELQP